MQLNGLRQNRVAASSLVTICLLFTVQRACAGTDAGLAYQPWGQRQHLELNASTLFERSGPTTAGAVGINIYHGDFRLRPMPKDPHQTAFGADVTHINIQGSVPALGPRLVDQSYAVGFQLGHVTNDWNLGMVAGIGYSGSTPYTDGGSVYAKGSLILDHKFNKQDSLALVVDYNGNRTFLPDWPIPTLVYQHIEGQKLAWVLGIPVGALHWMPNKRWTIDLSYTPIICVNANAEYEFVKHWKLYASYQSNEWAFHRDGTDPSRRIFFEQNCVEGGLRWVPLPMLHLAVGAGYAFEQKFSRGWDLRDATTLLKLHDAPYIRLQATLYF